MEINMGFNAVCSSPAPPPGTHPEVREGQAGWSMLWYGPMWWGREMWWMAVSSEFLNLPIWPRGWSAPECTAPVWGTVAYITPRHFRLEPQLWTPLTTASSSVSHRPASHRCRLPGHIGPQVCLVCGPHDWFTSEFRQLTSPQTPHLKKNVKHTKSWKKNVMNALCLNIVSPLLFKN